MPRSGHPVLAPPLCQGCGFPACDGAPALVGVNVVRPVGRSTLTPRARRRLLAGAGDAAVLAGPVGGRSVVAAGPGSGWSEVSMTGDRSTALDTRVAPE